MYYYRCRKRQMITWRYCGISNAHWHVTIQFRAKIKFIERQKFIQHINAKVNVYLQISLRVKRTVQTFTTLVLEHTLSLSHLRWEIQKSPIQFSMFCSVRYLLLLSGKRQNGMSLHDNSIWPSNGNRTPDLLILSPTPYPLGQMLPGYAVITYPGVSKRPTLEIAHFMIAIIYSHSYSIVIVSVPSLLLNNCTSLYLNCNTH